MNKYNVSVQEVHVVPVTVEARSEQEAQALAEEIVAAGCYEDGQDLPQPEYSYTVERYMWPCNTV